MKQYRHKKLWWIANYVKDYDYNGTWDKPDIRPWYELRKNELDFKSKNYVNCIDELLWL